MRRKRLQISMEVDEVAEDRFLSTFEDKPKIGYVGRDRIPGTDKITTYFSNNAVFSKESDIEVILSKRERAYGDKKVR